MFELQIDAGSAYFSRRPYDVRLFSGDAEGLAAIREFLSVHEGEFRFRLRGETTWQTKVTEEWARRLAS